MLYCYKGVDINNKKRVGYLIANNKKEALSMLDEEESIKIVYYLQRRLDNPKINKIREKFDSGIINIQNQIDKKSNNKKDNKEKNNVSFINKFKKVNIKMPKIKLPFLNREKKVEMTDDMYVNLLNAFKKEATLNDYEDETFEEEPVKIIKTTRALRGKRVQERELDMSLFQNEENNHPKKNKRKVRIKDDEIILFTRKLSMMLSSGVVMLKSLQVLSDTSTANLAKILNQVIEDIQSGNAFSYAISRHPAIFDTAYVAMVSIGENSGTLDRCLLDVVDFKEKKAGVKKKLKTASIYPIMIGGVLSVFLLAGSIFFIPMFKNLFEEQGIDLPGLTKFIFTAADYMPYIVGIIILSVFFIKWLRKILLFFDRFMRRITDKISLNTPIVKSIVLLSNMYTFSSTIALMLQNGIRLKDALILSRNTIKNVYIKNEIKNMSDLIVQGCTLSEAMEKQRYFDRVLMSVVLTGEESGRIGDSLREISIYYNEELNKKLGNVMEIIQPISILIIAIMAIPIIVGIYLPLLSISGGGLIQ